MAVARTVCENNSVLCCCFVFNCYQCMGACVKLLLRHTQSPVHLEKYKHSVNGKMGRFKCILLEGPSILQLFSVPFIILLFYILRYSNARFVNYSFNPKHAKTQGLAAHLHKILERRLLLLGDNIFKFLPFKETDFKRTTSSVK